MGSSIVAVDTTSVFPDEATRLPQVGYLRRLSGEGILSLSPTLFLGTDDAQPESVLGQLASAGVPVELVTNAPGLEAAYERVRQVGRAVSKEREAQALVAGMRAELNELGRILAGVRTKPSVLFIYARGQGSAQVAGRGTSAQMMIELSGGKNAIDQFEGFRPLTAEAALMADPDFLLMPDKGLDSLDGVEGLLRQPGISHTRAGRERRVIAVDDSRLLGFGPRVASGVRELARRLHPDLPGLAP
jgi:iron complex transport system substrate-binding protein